VDGQKLCDLARKGITVERRAREVKIYRIDIISMDIPRIKMRVHCSKGTYIRTLCQDIGEKLGCYGCMESLLRTRVAQFRIADALRLSEVERYFAEGTYEKILSPVDSCFEQYSALFASAEADRLLENGNRIPAFFIKQDHVPKDSFQTNNTASEMIDSTFRLYNSNGKFVGIYTYQKENNDYKPLKLFMD
jgi:tRNA pseudouridine55 synthase